MRGYSIVLLLLILSTTRCGVEQAESHTSNSVDLEKNKEKNAGIFGYESGKIEISYNGTKNKEILYFDKWGLRSAKYIYSENRENGEVKLTSIEIVKNNVTYIIDPVEKSGLKIVNPPLALEKEEEMEVLGFKEERKLSKLGYHRVGTENIAGKECSIWEDETSMISTKNFLHKGLLLKTLITIEGEEIVSQASDIQVNIKIPATKFALPKGIKF